VTKQYVWRRPFVRQHEQEARAAVETLRARGFAVAVERDALLLYLQGPDNADPEALAARVLDGAWPKWREGTYLPPSTG
jgi:hypothetical protein